VLAGLIFAESIGYKGSVLFSRTEYLKLGPFKIISANLQVKPVTIMPPRLYGIVSKIYGKQQQVLVISESAESYFYRQAKYSSDKT